MFSIKHIAYPYMYWKIHICRVRGKLTFTIRPNPYSSLERQPRVDAWVTRQVQVWSSGILANICYFMCFDGLFVIIKTQGDLDHVASTISPFLMMTNKNRKQIKLQNLAKTKRAFDVACVLTFAL